MSGPAPRAWVRVTAARARAREKRASGLGSRPSRADAERRGKESAREPAAGCGRWRGLAGHAAAHGAGRVRPPGPPRPARPTAQRRPTAPPPGVREDRHRRLGRKSQGEAPRGLRARSPQARGGVGVSFGKRMTEQSAGARGGGLTCHQGQSEQGS